MHISISDFIIHVDETLTREQLDRLEASIREHSCVVSAGAHDRTPHLMLVAYDPECVDSKTILANVTSQGFRATSIGL